MALIRSGLKTGASLIDSTITNLGIPSNGSFTAKLDSLYVITTCSKANQTTVEAAMTGCDILEFYLHTNQYNHDWTTIIVKPTATTVTCYNDPNIGYPDVIEISPA